MTFSPTPVEIGDKSSTEDFQRMCRGVADIGVGTSDYISNHAIDLYPRMIEVLRDNGVDGPAGWLNRGSQAENHAKVVYSILKKASVSAMTVAKLMQAAERSWGVHIVDPIQEARSHRNRHTLNI